MSCESSADSRKTLTTEIDSDGRFKLFLPSEEFQCVVRSSAQGEIATGYVPLKQKVHAETGPVKGIDFVLAKLNIGGKVSLLPKTKEAEAMTVQLLSQQGEVVSAVPVIKGSFKVANILPGLYDLAIQTPNDGLLCWEQPVLRKVEVAKVRANRYKTI